MKNLMLMAIFVFFGLNLFAQTYNIQVKITDLKNEKIFLGYYYGDKTYVKDTLLLDANGKGTFRGDSLLHQGMYIVVMPSKNYFDLLVDADQDFSLETSSEKLTEDLKIKGSDINNTLLEFQKYMINVQKQSKELQDKIKEHENNEDSVSMLKSELKEITDNVKIYWDKIIAPNKNNILGIVVKLMKTPEIPEIEIPDNVQNKDSVRWFYSYNYNRNHYFDEVDFTDRRNLRTPIFHNKLETYFTKILIQDPDTVNHYIDIIANKAEKDKEMFQYIVRYCINTFQKSNIMGMDKVFVHVAEKYYLSGKVDWLDEETLKKIRDEVAKLRFNLIGNKAQDLKMETIHQEYAKLYDISSKFTLVYFFEPNCGHCKKVTPEIHSIYNDFNRRDFEVFAVYTQGDKKEWSDYIFEKGYDDWINVWDPYNLTNFRMFYNVNSTPTIYLLDQNKKIIAKRISSESLRSILEIELGKKQ